MIRAMTGTLIDCFELPQPAIERYRVVQVVRPPVMSLDLEVEFEDSETYEKQPVLQSDRFLRARCWSSED
jgi:hypothetical protein